jgi:GT2 family glycosyltransferase
MESEALCSCKITNMQKTVAVASITIAYNGEKLLSQHLESLLNQTRALDEIIVVNNASTDETAELLRKSYPQITVIDLPFNTGVGGGYAAGLEYAIQQKSYDWIWLFDQDSVPDADTLERLLQVRNRLNGQGNQTAVLAPRCVNACTQREYPGLLWNSGWKPVTLSQPLTFVDAVISSGSLIRSSAIRTAGPPRKDFFIDYVDLEHCLRLRSAGFSIAVVRDAVLRHALGSPRLVTFASFNRVWADHEPWREYYKARNEVFTIWTHYPNLASKLSVIRRLVRHALGVLLFGKQKQACLKMMYLGIVDGLAGRLGIRSFDKPFVVPAPVKRSHA